MSESPRPPPLPSTWKTVAAAAELAAGSLTARFRALARLAPPQLAGSAPSLRYKLRGRPCWL